MTRRCARPAAPTRTKAESETLFRFDEEDHVLWATTTTPRVAARWRRAGYALRVLSTYPDGIAASWEVRLPWTGQRAVWLRLFRLGLSQWRPALASEGPVSRQAHAPAHANGGAPAPGKGSGRVPRAEPLEEAASAF